MYVLPITLILAILLISRISMGQILAALSETNNNICYHFLQMKNANNFPVLSFRLQASEILNTGGTIK